MITNRIHKKISKIYVVKKKIEKKGGVLGSTPRKERKKRKL
jgi:hypothetical protein